MPGTSTSLRAQPARVFENYVFTRLVDTSAGLSHVNDATFVQVTGPGSFTELDVFSGAGAPGTRNAISSIIPIGFDFDIDGLTYKSWCASTNGWMVLVDPATGAFSESEVISGSSGVSSNIRPTFTSDAVLLAPWFDALRNSLNDAGQLASSPFLHSTAKISRLQQGFERASPVVDMTAYGISYCNVNSHKKGRQLIVRWSSISNVNDVLPVGSSIKFEVVLCENGTIEYRYVPRTRNIVTGSAGLEGATIGIFMPNGTNRWRDLSTGLGYRVDARVETPLGGYAYDAGYVDSHVSGSTTMTSSYSIGLVPSRNWPGHHDVGCTLSFSPPKLGRKVLPRRLMIERETTQTYPVMFHVRDDRSNAHHRSFDDRRSARFTVSGSSPVGVVSYPSTLPRFFGGSGIGTTERQDVFSGDLFLTGDVSKNAMSQYVDDAPADVIKPFNENARHEQGPSTTTGYFLTGTANTHAADGFKQSLRSKTHVRFTLPVRSSITMPANSSSIYYYNSATDAWQIPANTTYIIGTSASLPPSPNPYAGGDIVTSLSGVGLVFEDARGFGPVGNPVSSGSVTLTNAIQSDPVFGSTYTFSGSARIFGKEYTKSVRNNREYKANPEETFTAPISMPFLIEKAVFDIPFCAGRGWFEDMTQCALPLSDPSRKFNFGGPGLTVALYRQVKLGKGPDAPTMLDLILTGTITHVYDNTSSVAITSFSPVSTDFQIRPVGFLAYANPPGGIVNDSGTLTFTGSVRVETTALNTACMQVTYVRTFLSSNNTDSAIAAESLLTQPDLVLKNDATFPTTSVNVGFVSPFGRSGLGLRQSGRSIMGHEHVSWQGMRDQGALIVNNPFYVGSGGLSTQQRTALASPVFTASAATVITLGSYFPSPYLVMPNDQLVISISKTRPAVFDAASTFTSSLSHDVSLNVGDINVTLYGCQLREGKEFHDQQTLPLGSNAVHEAIGMDPIIDQFDVPYPHERSGSFYDNGPFGTFSSKAMLASEHAGLAPGASDSYVIVQTVRDRKVSWVNARSYSQLSTSSVDLNITPSKAFRMEQWWEMAPDVSLAQFVDSSERYWDSMMPSISDCFAADGCGVFITPNGTFGNAYQIDTGASGSTGFNPRTTRMGWIWMDYNIPSLLASDYGRLINSNWSKAFPFEPRYQGVSRQVSVERSLVATHLYGGSPTVQAISPTRVNGFAFCTTKKATAALNSTLIPNSICWDWLVDVDLSSTNVFGYYVTGSAGADDVSRGLYGFGDKNTCFNYNGATLGTNHAIETRDLEGPHPDGVGSDYDNNFFTISPVIRGWKYGVISGMPLYTKAYWRPNRFGQFRDMLEQRPYSKFFRKVDKGTPRRVGGSGVQPGIVTVTFIDQSTGRRTSPENTWSTNLSTECTSSVPFHDGLSLNRLTIDPRVLNLHPTTVKSDAGGNIHIA